MHVTNVKRMSTSVFVFMESKAMKKGQNERKMVQ